MLEPAMFLESTWREAGRKTGWDWAGGPDLFALHRPSAAGAPRFYLSAGIHGDEPAGPLAAYELLSSPDLWEGWEVFFFPLLNPGGLRVGTRDSVAGVDLNRDYFHRRSPEIAAHRRMLDRLPRLDVTVCLHEDWEATGVYLYYLHRDGLVDGARRVLAAMGRVIPVDPAAQIDGRPAEQGLIHRRPEEFEGENWPEAIYLGHHLTDHGYTLETPSSRPIGERVEAHCAGVRAILREFSKTPRAV